MATLSAMLTLAIEVWGMRPDSLNPCTRVERNPEPPRALELRGGDHVPRRGFHGFVQTNPCAGHPLAGHHRVRHGGGRWGDRRKPRQAFPRGLQLQERHRLAGDPASVQVQLLQGQPHQVVSP